MAASPDFPPESKSRALRLVNREPVEVVPEGVPNEPPDPLQLTEVEASRARVLEGRRDGAGTHSVEDAMTERARVQPRVIPLDPQGTTMIATYENGVDYTDGYRVTVGWSEEDEAWIAELSGCQAEPNPIGDGQTQELALCALACSLACLADALFASRKP